MLRVDDPLDLSVPPASRAKSPPDILSTFQRHDSAPVIALSGRDNFVADTALRIDQLQATIRLLSRDVGQIAGKVAELQEIAAQENRWYVFERSDKRRRDGKLDEMVRSFRDLKSRLDRMEVRSGGDYHAYNSFEAVSRKLAEIERLQEEAKHSRRGDTLRALLLSGAMIAAATIIGLSIVFSPGSVLG